MWLCRMIAGISGQPSQKLRRFCPGVLEDFREDTRKSHGPVGEGFLIPQAPHQTVRARMAAADYTR
jgi:hypothetical protein